MTERIEAFKPEHLDECAYLFMTAFNAEPWNDEYTLDTAKKQLAWHLEVPGCLGLVSVKDGIVALDVGYRETPDVQEVFHLSVFCLGPEVQRRRGASRLMHTLDELQRKAGVSSVCLGSRKAGPAEAFDEKHG